MGVDLPARRSIDDIERDLATVSAHIDAAEHRRLSLIRELVELGITLGDDLSVAQWLSWRLGLSPGAARERVRVAEALGSLPRIDDALKHGELSYSKVRAMTRVAAPANEEALLEQARVATAAQLEKICRRLHRVQRSQGEPVCTEADRYVVSRQTDDGMVVIEAKLLPDEAAAVMKALETTQREAFERQQREERAAHREAQRPHESSDPSTTTGGSRGDSMDVSAEVRRPARRPGRADALLELAEGCLAGKPGAPSRPAAERRQILLALTPSTLADGSYQVAMDDGTRVSAETLRRVACDAGLIPAVVDDRGHPLDVGRRRRTIPPAIRRAMQQRDGGCCQYPGCPNRLWLEGHHATSWLDGGETRLSNLLSLCRKHHRLLHEGGYTVEATPDDNFVFRDDRGRVVERAPKRPRLPDDAPDRLVEWHARSGIRIDDQTCQCTWDGSPVDYDACVEVLLHSPRRRSTTAA